MDAFSKRFKKLKNEKKLTYQQIADHMHLKLRTVQYYASGKRKPDFHGLISLADLFQVSLDYLVGRKIPKN